MLNTKVIRFSRIFLFLFLQFNSLFGQNIPPAPTGLRVTATECGKISLAWDDYGAGINEDRFDLYRSSNGANGNYDYIGSESTNTLKFENIYSFSEPGVIYFYKIKAFFGINSTSFSLPIEASYNCETPTGLTITNSECGAISLTWNDFSLNSNETGFYIFRSESENGYYFPLSTVEANVLNMVDKYNLTFGKTYYYKIKGKFGFNTETSFSNTVSSSFTCQSPTNLQLTNSDCNGVTLNWSDFPNGINETGYEIYRAESINNQYYSIGYTQANVLTFLDDGKYGAYGNVSVGKTYFYQVKGLFNSTLSDFSNAISANFDCAAPQNLSLTYSDCNKIILNWNNHTSASTNGYIIQKSINGINGFYYGTDLLNTNTYTDQSNYGNLYFGTDYYYKVAALVNNFRTAFSDPILVKLVCPGPTNLHIISASCGKVKIGWNDIQDSANDSGYEIFRSEDQNGVFTSVGTTEPDILTFEDNSSGLIPNKTYFYKIKTKFIWSSSDFSQLISASFSCPSAPLNFRVISTDCGNINFAWDDFPAEFIETGFDILKVNTIPPIYTQLIGTTGPNITTFSDTGHSDNSGLSSAGNSYQYRVFGKFGNSYSVGSQIVSSSFTCPTPSNPTFVSSNCGQIKISWADFPSAYSESGFEIYRATAANGYYSKVGQVAANVLEFEDANGNSFESSHRFNAGQTYYYKIKGLFNNNRTVFSGATSGLFTCPIPQNLRIKNIDCGQVTLEWDPLPVTNFNIIAYVIGRTSDLASTENDEEYINYQTTVTFQDKYIDNISAPNYYRIRALYSNQAFSEYSTRITANFDCPAPTNLRINKNTCDEIIVAWDDLPAQYTETGFNLYNKDGYSISLPANTLSHTLPGNGAMFQVGKEYELFVSASFGQFNRTKASEGVLVKFSCNSSPSLTITNGENCNGINMNWNDLGAGFEETSYILNRSKTTNANDYHYVAELPANSTNFIDNGQQYNNIETGRQYFYKVIAKKGNLVLESNTVSGQINCTKNINSLTINNNQNCSNIVLNWADFPVEISETGYVIYASIGTGNNDFVEIGRVAANITTFSNLIEFQGGLTYNFKIAGIFQNIIGNMSNIVSTTINCNNALTLSLVNTSCGEINLSWNAFQDISNLNSYAIYRSKNGEFGDYEQIYFNSNTRLTYTERPSQNLLLEAGQKYYYKVVGYFGAIKSPFSNIIEASFSCNNKPTGLQLVNTDCNKIKLIWNPSEGQGKYNQWYSLYRSSTGIDGEYEIIYGNNYEKLPTQVDSYNLIFGKEYFYKLRSVIDWIGSDFSDPISVIFQNTNRLSTTKSGPWTDPTTWSCGRVPTSLDEILINNGHMITIGENLIGNCKNIENNGELEFGTNSKIILHQ